MGKKQHQKDRLFLTTKEWKEEWGGFKEKKQTPYQRLPFYCCAVSFTNFDDPVCTEDGTVFDVTNIVPYIKKHGSHPVTGKPLELGELIPLTFHKNADGEYECPILKKVFTQHSHIVAIKPSGNVFCYEAIHQFNIKLKDWHDLISGEEFTRKDIIHIQNPKDVQVVTTEQYDHVKRNLGVGDDDEAAVIRNSNRIMDKVKPKLGAAGDALSEPTSRRALALAQLETAIRDKRLAKAKTAAHHTKMAPSGLPIPMDGNGEGEEEEDDWRLRGPSARPAVKFKPGTSTWDTDDAKEAARKMAGISQAEAEGSVKATRAARPGKPTPAQWWEQNYKPRYKESVETKGLASRAATATTADVVTKNERIQQLVHRNPTLKGYITLHTSKGDLNIELHCDLTPRACENFLALCEMGFYTGTCFHRSIRNFMIQGGDPTGTGKGGESIYGPKFADEIDTRLQHDRRGVLGMANTGRDTNASQFYILFKSARHLDLKHTVFGCVVGGLAALSSIENVATDGDDRPRERIEITGCTVHKNPYLDMLKAEQEAAGTTDESSGRKPPVPGAAPSVPSKRKAADAGIKEAPTSMLSEFDAW